MYKYFISSQARVKNGSKVINRAGNRYIYRYIRKIKIKDIKSDTKVTKK